MHGRADRAARYCDSLDGGEASLYTAQGPRAAEARRRYAQARQLQPADGMLPRHCAAHGRAGAPLNQLAVLATHALNDGCDALFYYLCRCCLFVWASVRRGGHV